MSFTAAANPGTILVGVVCPRCNGDDVKRLEGEDLEEVTCDECGEKYHLSRPKDREKSPLEKEWEAARAELRERCGTHDGNCPKRRCLRPQGHAGECLFE
jgi:Zn ribbon nucleic-acid-binding protein